LTGQIKSRADFDEDDSRIHFPRFSEENFQKNLDLVNKLTEIAEREGCTTSQLALAWVLAQGNDVFDLLEASLMLRLFPFLGREVLSV